MTNEDRKYLTHMEGADSFDEEYFVIMKDVNLDVSWYLLNMNSNSPLYMALLNML